MCQNVTGLTTGNGTIFRSWAKFPWRHPYSALVMTGGIRGRAAACQRTNKITNKTQVRAHHGAAKMGEMKLGPKSRDGNSPNGCLLQLMFDPAAKAESRGD